MPLVKVLDRKRIPFINHSGPTPHAVNLTETQIATLKNLGYNVVEVSAIPARKTPIAPVAPVQEETPEPEVVEEVPAVVEEEHVVETAVEETVAESVEEEVPAEEEVAEEAPKATGRGGRRR